MAVSQQMPDIQCEVDILWNWHNFRKIYRLAYSELKKKKKETRVWLQISQNKKDITQLIPVHIDSIIILLSFGTLFIHIRPWRAAQQSTCKTSTLFLSKLIALLAFAGALITIQSSALHCVLWLHNLKTWTKTVLTCFPKMIAEQPSLTQ